MKDPQAASRIAMDAHLRLDIGTAVAVRRDLQHQVVETHTIIIVPHANCSHRIRITPAGVRPKGCALQMHLGPEISPAKSVGQDFHWFMPYAMMFFYPKSDEEARSVFYPPSLRPFYGPGNANRVTVYFHSLEKREQRGSRECVEFFQGNGFKLVSPDWYLETPDDGRRRMMLSFDDNYRSWYDTLPPLDELKVRAIFEHLNGRSVVG